MLDDHDNPSAATGAEMAVSAATSTLRLFTRAAGTDNVP